MTRWMLRSLFLALLVGAAWLPARAAPADWDNETDGYLENGGFEGGFYVSGDELIADQWLRLYLQGTSADWTSTCLFANAGPTCDQGWVEKIAGLNSHIITVEEATLGQPFDTVLYQSVGGLTAGKAYSFSGWILKLWGGSANHTTPPADPFSYGSWLGVDPTGGSDPNAASVVWSAPHWEWIEGERSRWQNQRLAVTAQGSQATLFIRLWSKWHKPETQGIVDGMELFDAPAATLTSPSAITAAPTIGWSAAPLPAMIVGRGPFQPYAELQQFIGGEWVTVLKELPGSSVAAPLAEGQTGTFRVVPTALQPRGQPLNWPPTVHVGLPTAAVTLTRDSTPPSAAFRGVPRWVSAAATVPLAWRGSDAVGIASFDVDYRRVGQAAWTAWLAGTTATSAAFGAGGSPVLVGGDEWELRVRAHDLGGLSSEWASVRLGVYGALLTGTVRAVNGQPLVGAQIVASPYPFSSPPLVDGFGNYLLPLASPGSVTLAFLDSAGQKRLPDTVVAVGPTTTRDWRLPPLPNAVANGHFESSGSWSGAWLPTSEAASGSQGATLGSGQAISQLVTATTGHNLSLAWRALAPNSTLQVQLGGETWLLSSATSSGWLHVSQRIASSGAQPLTLTVLTGSAAIDEVALGAPQPAPYQQFLPLAGR